MKPIVEGLEAEVQVIRLDFLSSVDRAAARAAGLWLIPVAILFDGQGQELDRQVGLLQPGKLLAPIRATASDK